MNNSAKPWDLINPNIEKLNDEGVDARLSICNTCNKFIHITKQCKECGCIMPLKAKISNAVCPIGKW
jgi:hypothetical protein